MRAEDFASDRAGRTVPTGQGGVAFIPADLPPAELRLEGDLLARLSEADRAIGKLAGVAAGLPNPRLLATPFRRREALLSSKIEGTQASLSDLARFEAHPQEVPAGSDVQEVANYLKALDQGLDPARKLPLSLRLLRDLHRVLMEGVRGDATAPGEFRRVQNHIGPPGAPIEAARYVPPPVPDMERGLDRLEHFLHERRLPPLIRIGLVHYQFEAIHPFLDGNGRIGRLLIALQLAEEGVLPEPLLYLSAWFDQHRAEYYDRLLAVSARGEFEAWLGFFLDGVIQQASDSIRRAGRLRDLQEQMHRQLKSAKGSSLMYRVADLLLEQPALTTKVVRERLGVSHRGAMIALLRLAELKLVREPEFRERNRIFLANQVIALLEREVA